MRRSAVLTSVHGRFTASSPVFSAHRRLRHRRLSRRPDQRGHKIYCSNPVKLLPLVTPDTLGEFASSTMTRDRGGSNMVDL